MMKKLNVTPLFSKATSRRLQVETLEQRAMLNAVPIATNDAFSFPSDVSALRPSPGILDNDVDSDGDALTVASVEPPASGILTWEPDGRFEYVPNAGFQGPDSFRYEISDGIATSEPATVYLRIGTYNQSVLADHPLGYWRLGEAASRVAFDSSPNEFDGDYSDVTLAAPGAIASELDTAGVFKGGSQINLGRQTELQSLQNDFSIEAWIKPTSLSGHNRIFANTSGPTRPGFGFGTFHNSLIFTTFGKLDYISQPVLELDRWYHVAVVFDSFNDATFFINGERLETVIGSSPADASRSAAFIGGLGGNESFRGSIDEVAIYNGTLSDMSIRNRFLMGSIDSGTVPIAVDDVYTISGGSRLDVSTPTLTTPRHSFADEFSGTTLNPNLEDATSSFRVQDGVLKTVVDRQYVRTFKTDYITGDFELTVDVDLTTDRNTIEFIGIGPGERGSNNEPADAFFVYLNSLGFEGDVGVSAKGGPIGVESIGRINRPGIHRVRLSKVGNQLSVDIDAFVEGAIQSDLHYWIGDVATFLPFLDNSNSRLILGGSTETSFDNLKIVSSLDDPAVPGLLQNDTYSELESPLAVLVDQPEYGQLEFQNDGSFSYTPDPDFTGTDSFTYYLDVENSRSNTATVLLRVNGLPVTTADTYSVSENGVLDAKGPVVEIVRSGFNDQLGIGSDETANSPYRLDSFIASQGSVETGWFDTWKAEPNIPRITSNVTFEGDGSLWLRPTSNTFRTWYQPQGKLLTIEQNLRFTENSQTLVVLYDGYDDCCGINSGPQFGVFPDGTIAVLTEGEWVTSSLTWEPDRWYEFTAIVDVPNQSWKLLFDGVEVLADRILGFRGEPSQIDSINYLSEVSGLGLYVDNFRVTSGNSIPGVLSNDQDADEDRLSAQLVETTEHGDLAFHSDGTFTYRPNRSFFGLDSFTYRAIDGFGESAPTTVTLIVEPTNDAPVAQDDVYDLGLDRTLSIPVEQGVLRNDADIDGDPLTAVLVEGPAFGQLTFNDDGSFQYVSSGTTLTDHFSYQASDGQLMSEVRTVTIIATPPSIELDNFDLRPNMPGQKVQIFVSGGHLVSGIDLFAMIGDGGPERASLNLDPGVDGPAITSVDLKSETIFADVTDSASDLGSLPQVANWSLALTDGGSVAANGLLATLTVDTTGFFEGSWDLSLSGVLSDHPSGPFDTTFADWSIDVFNGSITVVPVRIAERLVFYNDSSWDGNDSQANANDDFAIATDKSALLPGETARFANYTSYSKGLNGIIVDIANHPDATTLSLDDFEFRTGRNDQVDTWQLAPQPTMSIRPAGGQSGSDRFTFVWPDGAIRQTWLEVRIKSNESTLLPRDDAFYFGNAIGETGNAANETLVTSVDVVAARDNQRGPFDPAPLTDVYDFNRDKIVSSVDVILARDNQAGFLTSLPLINPEAMEPVAAIAAHDLVGQAFQNVGRVCFEKPGPRLEQAWKPGDSNQDGQFNSEDLILVFSAGEFEDQVFGNSTWDEGDWDCNGDFDSSDLVLAFQAGDFSHASNARPNLDDLN